MDRIGLALTRSEDLPRREYVDIVRRAEAAGFDSFWTNEAWGRDAFVTLTQLACHTDRIKLATGIVTVYSRTPSLTGQAAATLDDVSGGRFMLGLGVSGPVVIRKWHGVDYGKPVTRTREYIQIIRKVIAGERVNHDGEYFHLRDFRIRFNPLRPRLPIYVASIGQRNLELTGEVADGWLGIFMPATHLPAALAALARGAAKVGRSPDEVDKAAYILTAVSSDREQARSLTRAHIAYYVGGMGTFYHRLMTEMGYGRQADAVRAAWARSERPAAAAAIDDAMLDALAICGNAEECRRQLDVYRAAGLTLPVLSLPNAVSRDVIDQTIDALAPVMT